MPQRAYHREDHGGGTGEIQLALQHWYSGGVGSPAGVRAEEGGMREYRWGDEGGIHGMERLDVLEAQGFTRLIQHPFWPSSWLMSRDEREDTMEDHGIALYPPGITTLWLYFPLARGILCLNCDVVFGVPGVPCPACNSEFTLPLARFLGSQETGGISARPPAPEPGPQAPWPGAESNGTDRGCGSPLPSDP